MLLSPSSLAAPPLEDAPAADSTISLESSPRHDAEIEARLEAIYGELPRLENVEVEVSSGVVHLRGSVLELDARDRAESLAERVEGVTAVDNGIEQIRSLDRRIDPLVGTLEGQVIAALNFLPLLVIGLLIIGAAWLLARLLGRWHLLERKVTRNSFLRALAGRVVRAAIVMLGIVLALELMGATTLVGAVFGTAGVVGIALGIALKDTTENYIASISLSVRKPFEPNDLVSIGEHTGRVVRLSSRATILLTLDGNHVRIPNAVVFKATIVNYTRHPQRRFYFEFGVAVEADLLEVQELACATIAATPGVLGDPRPTCHVEGFGDSAMLVSVGGWLDQREADWFKVNSEARRRIKAAFDEAGIEIPEPIFRVRTRDLDKHPEPRAPSGEQVEPPEGTDVSPDHHITEQVADERAETGERDLLDTEAPIE